jgi:hypothetical protein
MHEYGHRFYLTPMVLGGLATVLAGAWETRRSKAVTDAAFRVFRQPAEYCRTARVSPGAAFGKNKAVERNMIARRLRHAGSGWCNIRYRQAYRFGAAPQRKSKVKLDAAIKG